MTEAVTSVRGEPDLRVDLEKALGRRAESWHPALSFSRGELPALGRRLYHLAVQVGGEPQDEEYVTDLEAVKEWAWQMAEEGLRRHFRMLAGGLGWAREAPVRWDEGAAGAPGNAPGNALGSAPGDAPGNAPVTIGGWVSKLDLAGATQAELRKLPGVGTGLAASIIALRERGGLREVDDLTAVSGLGAAKLAALRPLVYLSPASRAGVWSTPALDAFRRLPDIRTFVDLLLSGGGEFVTSVASSAVNSAGAGTRSGPGLGPSVLIEIERAAVATAADPPPGGGGRPITVEEAARLGRLYRRAREIEETTGGQPEAEWAGLVNGSAYRDLCLRLIERARREVRVVMFFMTYVPGRDHPSNALVESLAAARRRGARVTVTLDLDRPGDVFGSRFVNRAAFDYLKAAGVEVVWDTPERLTHTKLLIVDGCDVLAGSHNWTAGSMYAYDDKSLVVRSPALAEVLAGVTGL